MTALRTALAGFLALLTLAAGPALAQPTDLALETGDGPVFRVTIDGMIDNALASYVDRALADAADADAAVVVFRIDTFGGLLDAADQIRKSILSSEVPTVAVIDRNAASAGALIAYANDRIVFVPGASMGAATAVNQTGEYAPEKIQSYTRGLMRATAEATGRDPRIAEAMVDERLSIPGVVEEGTLLTVSSDEALALGIADAVLPSTDAVVDALGLADREQTPHAATRAEQVLRFLGSPVLASLLLMMMMGGLYFEIQTPGVGFAGAVALVGAALFFAPHYLLGLVESWEIALFAVGVGLLLVEVFVTPGFGVFGIAGLVLVLGALLVALVPNVGFKFPDDGEIARATTTLAAALVLLVLFTMSLGRMLPRSERLNRLVLAPELSAAEGYTSADLGADLVGRTGTALTGLRPSGTVEVDGRRVDVVSEGGFVSAGAAVEVVRARGAVVVVREVA
ncbi:NfeD family protein [Rubrivirga sp. IMCC45206]|uniref:NfeD family protein n=1 Tax=Rubrivirga sp. IMCC45206 TaxID=3391614 RepID=UPI00398FFD0A